jgi:hypothetical protein
MSQSIEYGPRERFGLLMLAVAAFAGLNGVFLYALFGRPWMIEAALTNPLALAFIAEALVLVGVLAWLLGRWGVSRLHWGWFVVLSLVGGLAFALPVVLLASRPGSQERRAG